MKHIEHIKVFTLDTPPVSEHIPCDLSNRCFFAAIVNDVSGVPNASIPSGYRKSDKGVVEYTIEFDLPDDIYYVNSEYHHIALRDSEYSKAGTMDFVFILCESPVVSKDPDDAASRAAHGRFVVYHPDGSKRFIEPTQIDKGLRLLFPTEPVTSHDLVGMVMAGVDQQSWGGARPGAGRPSTGRTRQFYYVTPEENEEIKKLIKKMREQPAE